ncbi:MAG: midcut-by-XrtH protein [Cocleimonas sp.]
MYILKNKGTVSIVMGFFLMLISSSVFAGSPVNGLLTYAPLASNANPTDVPTLSGIMLIVMSLLLFVVGFRIAKQKNSKAGKLFMTLISVTALATGFSGAKIISEVHAGLGGIFLSISGGGSVMIPPNVISVFNNNSGVTQKVISITLPPNCNGTAGGIADLAECTVNLNLPNSNSCFVDCENSTQESDGSAAKPSN